MNSHTLPCCRREAKSFITKSALEKVQIVLPVVEYYPQKILPGGSRACYALSARRRRMQRCHIRFRHKKMLLTRLKKIQGAEHRAEKMLSNDGEGCGGITAAGRDPRCGEWHDVAGDRRPFNRSRRQRARGKISVIDLGVVYR